MRRRWNGEEAMKRSFFFFLGRRGVKLSDGRRRKQPTIDRTSVVCLSFRFIDSFFPSVAPTLAGHTSTDELCGRYQTAGSLQMVIYRDAHCTCLCLSVSVCLFVFLCLSICL